MTVFPYRYIFSLWSGSIQSLQMLCYVWNSHEFHSKTKVWAILKIYTGIHVTRKNVFWFGFFVAVYTPYAT